MHFLQTAIRLSVLGLTVLLAACSEQKPSSEMVPGLSIKGAREYLFDSKKEGAINVFSNKDAIPDEATAIAVASVYWNNVYGKKVMDNEMPFRAFRIEDSWIVTGSIKRGLMGGTAQAVLRAKDGAVLNLTHLM